MMLARYGFLLILWLAAPAAAQVYKYVDENGIVNYTNVKPDSRRYKVQVIGCYGTCRKRIDWHTVALDTESYAGAIRRLSGEFLIDEALLRSLIHAESGFRADAVSPKGALGLMQLMPATATMLQVGDPFDPDQNLAAGTLYLAELLVRFGNDEQRALAAYNAGPEVVEKNGGIPPVGETREYLRRINILRPRYAAALAASGGTAASAMD